MVEKVNPKLFQTFTSWKRLDLDSRLKVTGCFLATRQFVSSKSGGEGGENRYHRSVSPRGNFGVGILRTRVGLGEEV